MRRESIYIATFILVLVLFVNAGYIEEEKFQKKKTEDINPDKTVNYVIITTDTLKDSAEKFAKYRKQTGYVTTVHTVSECMKKFPEVKSGDAVRNTILEYRSKAGLGNNDKLEVEPLTLSKDYECPNFYVLLLGDITSESKEFDAAKDIPGFYKRFKTDPGITGAGRREKVPSDNPYACRPGDDDVPTVAVGRLTFSTTKQVELYLRAVKKYELKPPEGLWRRKINVFAGDPRFEGVPKFVSNIIENIFKTGVFNNLGKEYEGTLTYANVDSPYAYAPSKFNEKLVSDINEGSLLLNYVGHGWKTSVDRLYFNDKRYSVFTVKDAEKVDCKGKPPIAAFFTCYTGCYDMEELSLAETLLANPKGPIGVIASSRISAEANYLLETAFFKATTIDKERTLGKIFLKMKRYMLTDVLPFSQLIKNLKLKISNLEGYAEGKRSHLWLYNLFGDPALKIAHPEIECELELKSDKVVKDSEIGVRVKAEGIKKGKALVTFECRLKDFLKEPIKISPTDNDFEKKAKKNHEIANNKLISSHSIKIKNSESQISIKIPDHLEPGIYIIRVLVTDMNKTGFTAQEFEIIGKE